MYLSQGCPEFSQTEDWGFVYPKGFGFIPGALQSFACALGLEQGREVRPLVPRRGGKETLAEWKGEKETQSGVTCHSLPPGPSDGEGLGEPGGGGERDMSVAAPCRPVPSDCLANSPVRRGHGPVRAVTERTPQSSVPGGISLLCPPPDLHHPGKAEFASTQALQLGLKSASPIY